MPLLPPPPRSTETELIDAAGQDRAEFSHSLTQVAQVDRMLGAERALRSRLREAGLERGIGSILDVGAGNGDVLTRLADWLETRSGGFLPVRRIALDHHPDAVAVGRGEHREVAWIRGDGRAIPLTDRSVDLVLSVLTLHHLDPADALLLLSEMARVARRGVVVSDLERSRLHWVGARVLAATLWRGNRLTRTDAPTSVRRAYTRAEMRGLMVEAGLGAADVRRHLPFRLIGVVRR